MRGTVIQVAVHQHHQYRAHTVRIALRQRTHIPRPVTNLLDGPVRVVVNPVMVILLPQVAA